MKKFSFIAMLFLVVGLLQAKAQTTASDIPVAELPKDVQAVLVKYVSILKNSGSLDKCAEQFTEIAGGTLVNEDGSLRKDVPQFSLKKDFNDVKWYAFPVKITRVNKTTGSAGYGSTAIKGDIYKIWIDKQDKSTGMPAPITIMVPKGHASIKTPKVINIGSL